MRSLLQVLLVRWAASLLSLAARLGYRSAGLGGAQDLFGQAAGRALREARRQQPGELEPSQRPKQPASRSAGGPAVSPPAGYQIMSARAHLPSTLGSALLLVDEAERLYIPVFVGSTEALAFKHRAEGSRFTRPLTHDLFDALLAQIGATVRCVRIEQLRDNVFIAAVVVRLADERTIELDSRASDAIVLAIGNDAPIFVAERVIEDAGRPVEGLDGDEPGPESAP